MAQPEKVIRIGAVSAAIFVNQAKPGEAEPRTFRSVSLQRRFWDGDNWQTSTSFSLAELPLAIEVLNRALTEVAAQEAVSSP